MKEAPADGTASVPNPPEAPPAHWSRQKEQAAGYWHLKFLLILFRFFPVIVLRILAFPVGLFYFLFSKRSRTESKRFLQKAAPFIKNQKTAKKCNSPFGPVRHIISFSLTLVEKLQSWGNKFCFSGIYFHDDDVGELVEGLEKGQGAFLFSSHLGNIELFRALASYNRAGVMSGKSAPAAGSDKVKITVIIDMKATENFNRIIKELNPNSALDVISADEINLNTAILLEEKLAAGEVVTIAGDRTSASTFQKNIMIPFLGEDAPFSFGAFYMAALLKAPIYFVLALRRGDLSLKTEYDMFVHKVNLSSKSTGVEPGDVGAAAGSRKERTRLSNELARTYAAFLENYCKETPFQWYNFHDFWSNGA